MKASPFILPIFVTCSLSLIYLLPTAGEVAQSAVIMDLPKEKKGWQLREELPTPEEIGTLAKDTEFSKATCFRPRFGEFDSQGRMIPDQINLSVVLSGADINSSIHRPERCMPAQGHTITSAKSSTITLKDGKSLKVKRLLSNQRLPTNAERTEFITLNCVTYYFFVGHNQITNDHLGRTFIDMKDRLIRGMDQRWAYVSLSSWYGQLPWIESEISEQEADQKIVQFLSEFAETQIDWDLVKP